MKFFLGNMFSRIGDLVIKMISVKTVTAVVVTYLAFKDPGEISLIVTAVMWSLVIGLRYAEKVANLVRK